MGSANETSPEIQPRNSNIHLQCALVFIKYERILFSASFENHLKSLIWFSRILHLNYGTNWPKMVFLHEARIFK